MNTVEEITYTEKELELLAEFIDEDTGEILYPESDGNPMSESTAHFKWITTIQGGLDSLFSNRADVFVAGDLLWYPVEGKPFIRVAPDVMVAFGRPKGQRGSYEQWKEGNIAPQVVMEILSKGNTAREMTKKFLFYQTHGVEEYYVYDHRNNELYVSLRLEDRGLITQQVTRDFRSPLLGVRFDISGEELQIFNPDNTSFLTYVEQDQQRKLAIEEENKAVEEENKALEEKDKERLQKEAAIEREINAIGEKEAAVEREKEALQEIERLKALLKEKGL